MILQVLVKRYDDFGGTKPGWQTRPVDFAINIDRNGNILQIFDIRTQEEKKKVRQYMLLPAEPVGRTNGIKPSFLCDNDGYLLGTDEKRGDKKFEAAAQLHKAVLASVDTDAGNALKSFFSNRPADAVVPRESEKDTGANCIFMVGGKYIHEYQELCDAWDTYFNQINAQGKEVLDLVSGELGILETLHKPILLPGVSMGRVPLISINAESFSSYGRTMRDPAAHISKNTTHKYVDTLNTLLKSPTHHKRFAQDTLVYWAEEGGELEASTFSWFMDPQENDANKVGAVLKSVTSGNNVEGIDSNTRFHILCLSPNGGRISVRFYHTDQFGNILTKIAEHYNDLSIYAAPGKAPEKFPHFPAWILLSETTAKKISNDAAPLLAGQLLNSIVTGARYPFTLYNAILTRIRAGEGVGKSKAAIIKAVLLRNYKSEVATVALNKDSASVPYTLGRLFSVLEAAQASAGITGLREQHFINACANPASTFPNLLKRSLRHASTSKFRHICEIKKTELIGKLDSESPFPATLSRKEQGEFIVGYYHQQQERFTKKENRVEEDMSNA